MKITQFLLAFALLAFIACGDDDSGSSSNELSYDQANQSSPQLDPGTHELAVYFPSADLQSRIGKKLHEVEVFLGVGALSYEVVIHGPGTATTPGNVLWSEDVTSRVNDNNWEIIKVDPPIEITGEDIWIGVKVVHDQEAQSVGCDSGPRQDGGDWIWSDSNQTWETFLQRTSDQRVNWNIKGHLQE